MLPPDRMTPTRRPWASIRAGQQGGEPDRAARLDDELQPFEQVTHGSTGSPRRDTTSDVVDDPLVDLERQDRRASTGCRPSAIVRGTPGSSTRSPGLERPARVVGALGLDADDDRVLAMSRAQRGRREPAMRPPPPTGHDEDIDRSHLSDQLQRGGPLPGHDRSDRRTAGSG